MTQRSPLWLYFTQLKSDEAKCHICNNIYSIKGNNVTNLRKHLARKHPRIDLKAAYTNVSLGEPSTSMSLLSSNDVDSENSITIDKKPMPCTNDVSSKDLMQRKKFDDLVLKMIVSDLHTPSIIEENGMRMLLTECIPNFELPTCKRLKSLLAKKYNKVVELLKTELSTVDFVTISIDTWHKQASTEQTIVTLTIHFINENWKMQSFLLGSLQVQEKMQTIEVIRDGILKICTEWNVQHKIVTIIMDKETNDKIYQAIALLNWPYTICFGHTLNSIVQNASKVFENLRLKLEKMLKFFKYNKNAKKILKKNIQIDEMILAERDDEDVADDDNEASDISVNDSEDDNDPEQQLWPSTLLIFERVKVQQETLITAIDIMKQGALFDLNDFQALAEICQILQPFAEVCKEFQTEKYISTSRILLLLNFLSEKLNQNFANKHKISKTLLRNLKIQLEKHFSNINENQLLCLANLLDPRFKCNGMLNDKLYENCKIEIEKFMLENSFKKEQSVNQMQATKNKKNIKLMNTNSIWHDFDMVFKEEDEAEEDDEENDDDIKTNAFASKELRKYCDAAIIMRHEDPLDWWRTHECFYPNLAKVARKYLTPVATCIPSERIFTSAGELLAKKRARSGNENLMKIIFLNENIAYF